MLSPFTALFLDIGGVLLTNGWDHRMQQRAAETFGLDYEEMSERHRLTFDPYENGKISLDEYLGTSFSGPRGRFRRRPSKGSCSSSRSLSPR